MKSFYLALVLLLGCALPTLSQNVRVDGVIQSAHGPAPNVFIAACSQPANLSVTPCTTRVPLCSSLTDVVCTSPNPVTSDGLGNYFFYIPPGTYTYQFYGTGLQTRSFVDQQPGQANVAGAVLLNPSADQTIATGHQLINRGTNQTGPAISTFDANIQGQAFNPALGQVAISGQNLNASTTSGASAGLQGLGQGFDAFGVWGVASNTVGNTVDFPNGGDFQAFLTCSASCGGGPLGNAAAALTFPSVGTTMGLASGYRGQASNLGLGTVTTMQGFEARANTNTGGGAVTNSYGYNVPQAQTVGATNAAFHSVDQGAGANNYGILLDGVTHNDLGGGVTKVGSLLSPYVTNSGTITGVTYYVDNCVVTGNDSNNGTAAATPFLTIAKVNSLSLNPGDKVLFRRGCTWREQLQTPSAGSALGSITFSAYGQGNLPVITGFAVTTGFSLVGGTVYSKGSVTTQPFVVAFNGNLLFYNHVGSSITTNQWDWAANVLYINVGANPSTGTVELDSANDAIFVNKQFVTIDSLAVTGGNVYGVEFGSGAGNDTIQNCDVYNTFWGIITNTGSGNNITIQDNQIHSTVENGMSLQNSGATGTIVQRNNVYGIGGRGGRSTNTQGIFLGSLGTGTVVQFNNLHDGGDDDSDHGVYMSGTSGVSGAPDVIRYNHIYNYAGWGIKVANSNWVDATYNLIHGTEGGMIVEQGSPSHINFYNNTIANTVAGGGGSGLRASVGSFITFKNNILYNVNDMVDGSKFNIFLDPSVTNFTSDYNEVWSATPNVSGFYAFASGAGQTWAAWQGLGFDTHGLNVDPLLANPANNDYRPSVGSPVNGAGVNLGAPYNRGLRISPRFSDDVSAIPNIPSLGADQQAFNLGGLGWDMGALVSDSQVPRPFNGTAPIVGGVTISQLSTPVTPVATCSGACAGGTWTYKIVAFDWLGNPTAASAGASATNAVTLTSVNYNTVTFNPQPGVWNYKVYRTASAGTPAQLSVVCTFYNSPPYVSTQFQFHSVSSFGSTYGCRDDGSVTTGSVTPSAINATGSLLIGAVNMTAPPASAIHGICKGVATANNTNGVGVTNLGGDPTINTCIGSAGVQKFGTVITHACTLANFYVNAGVAGKDATDAVMTLQDNATGLSLTCTVGTATNCHDTTHTAVATAGDMIWVKGSTEAATTLADVSVSVDCQ